MLQMPLDDPSDYTETYSGKKGMTGVDYSNGRCEDFNLALTIRAVEEITSNR